MNNSQSIVTLYLSKIVLSKQISHNFRLKIKSKDEFLVKKMPKHESRHYRQNKCAINLFFYKMIQLFCLVF